MGLNFFIRRKILKSISAMDLVPIRKCLHELQEDVQVIILVPKFRNEKVANFMLGKKSRFIKIHLDETGSAAWLEIDGIKDLRAICESMTLRFGEKFAQPEQRINKFITRLYEERYITFRQLEDVRKKK